MSDLNTIRTGQERALTFKNILPLRKHIESLPTIPHIHCDFGDWIRIESASITEEEFQKVNKAAEALKPWRKGPFNLFDIQIDSEWRSNLKYNFIQEHLDITDKEVLDVGCNNGYYLFRMLDKNPKKLVGFDPSALYRCQFDFINHFIQSKISFEMLGIEHIPLYPDKFDVIVCLGVIYHRSDPIMALKSLAKGLKQEGELLIDCLIIEGEEPIALVPDGRYAKMPNAYFIPTLPALENWIKRAGFDVIELIGSMATTTEEQRKTEWVDGESLDHFLDPNDPKKTIEGYPAPLRAYLKIRRKPS